MTSFEPIPWINVAGHLAMAVIFVALHGFESSALSVSLLSAHWAQGLSQHPNVYRLKGQ